MKRLISHSLYLELFFTADDDIDYPVDDIELSQRYYVAACKELKVATIRNVYEGLVKEKMTCKGMVMLKNDVKACSIALVVTSLTGCIWTELFRIRYFY